MAAAVVMYTQAFCGYCMAARRLLKRKGIDFEEIDVTMDADRRREMMERSGRRTVPQIFVGDTHVGGYDDLAALDAAGELDALLGLDSGTANGAQGDD
ncbi:MAG: glutaredoxin 3 [Gammaproteobacteria bacterium]|nr:MAG: glutaredoxin 3 [Gammaproteobacteria bacterium]